MKKCIVSLWCVLLAALQFVSAGQSDVTKKDMPDFAYPAKVEATSLGDLEIALRKSSGPEIVNALVRYGLAKTAVSSDSVPVVLAKIKNVEEHTADKAVKSMLQLLQARIYTSVYSADAYRINRRATVGLTADGDYSVWSKEQFFQKVAELISQAAAPRDLLLDTPLDTYAQALSYDRKMLTFYPTLYDFVANRAIECLQTFESGAAMLNPRLLFSPLDARLFPIASNSAEGEVLKLYASLIEGREATPAGLMALGKEINYTSAHMFGSGITSASFPAGKSEHPSQLFEALAEAYGKHSTSPYAIELLTDVVPSTLSMAQKKSLNVILDRFMEEHSDYFNINAVKNLRAQLLRKQVNASVPTQVAKGGKVAVEVSVENVDKVTLNLYDVTGIVGTSDDAYCKLPATRPSPVETQIVTFNDALPFSACRRAEIEVPDYGKYVVEPVFEGDHSVTQSYPVIACSDLSAGVFSGVGGSVTVAVDALTGAPRENVSVFYKPWNRTSPGETLPGSTDADGFMVVAPAKTGMLRPIAGSDRYAPGVNYYDISANRNSDITRGEIFTSLGLYHPGDKVEYSAIVYKTSGNTSHPVGGDTFTMVLRDANYTQVATSKLTTDAMGRGEGEFELPAAGLTGTFTLSLTDADGKNTFATKTFTVSDYKLPTFEVRIDNVSRPSALTDSAVVCGMAQTYAGFPVGDADVRLQLSVRTGFWYWAMTSPVFYETSVVTASDGSFKVVIPAAALASSPARGYFIADVSVTSPDGETHDATTGFNMGKPIVLSVNVPAQFVPGESKAAIEAKEYDGTPAEIALDYEIYSVEEPLYGNGEPAYTKVAESKCKSGDVAGVLTSLPTGTYTMRFAPVDSTLSDAVVVERVIVYRKGRKECPVNSLLWLPEREVVADAAGKCAISVGTAAENARVLMVMSDANGRIVSKQWLTPAKGMSEFKVTLPDCNAPARVYLRIVSNLQSESASVTVNPATSEESISIVTETFRDKVTPGNLETLKFKVSGSNGASPESAVMLAMANKAIDVLAPNSMSFSSWKPGVRGITVDGLFFGSNNVNLYGEYHRLDDWDGAEPQFEFYGRSFISSALRAGNLSMKLAASGVRIRGTAKVESAEAADEAVLTENVAMDYMSAMDSGAEAGAAGTAGETAMDGESYRPSEIPLAFFRPMLSTNPDGSLEVTYTVPDANTTWVLRALAYNRDMLTASSEVNVVASKPLMVSANTPRFVRCGDEVELRASVMNLTDSVIIADTKCEILDAATNNRLSTQMLTDTLSGKGRAVVKMRFNVPATLQALIFRVKSCNARFSDGEQVIIPVLPSAQDVVESDMFYIAPGQSQFSMPVDSIGSGRAYLRFTENPAWEVVSALPGLREGKISSSLDAAAAIFSAAVADGLMRDYPEIARTLRRWRDNPSDSALTSALEKNDVLKSVLLNSTPWVGDALNQTERMQRLVLLLDKRNTSKVIDQGVAELLKNSVSGGGWSWTPQYPELSEWCTAQILDMMGSLNRLGWMPENKNLSSMIENAVACIDRTAAARYAKSPKDDFTLYCYTRSKFPGVKQSTAAAKVIRASVQRIIAEWKEHTPVRKGVDAIVLASNGYTATARQVLQSLRELATVTSEKGMWWQQLENTTFRSLDKVGCTAMILDAFATVEPKSGDVEKIRQWLILQKTNTDWGNAVITSQVVASILTSGREITVNPTGTAIHIGETLVEPYAEYATGSFTEQITGLLRRPATLTVDRQADYPSFGAVVTMRTLPMDEVTAAGCTELSVEKQLSVFNGSEWVPSNSFSTGDRVMVTLTIKADSDMDYVVVEDKRAAAFEPVEQLPRPVWSEGLCFYCENRDSQTNLFIRHMPRGTYVLSYELFATVAGSFSSGVASAQSQYNPAIAAHTSGASVTVD